MNKEDIKELMGIPGTVMVKHENGKNYYLDHIGIMQVENEWLECVMYRSLTPPMHCCRAIDDFKKFTYIEHQA